MIKIVFMGTPDFAVPCLEELNNNYNVVGVFCQPDRPKGRGKKLSPPAVKVVAESFGLPVFQPERLRDEEVLSTLRSLDPDLIVVVAYGKILPETILSLPPLGCINIHGSLLPKFRGAAPIQWSIIKGEAVTGITSMYMAKGMDTGDMILKKETPIHPLESSGDLFERLAPMGAELLLETVPLLIGGVAPRIVQDETLVTYAPMIKKEDGLIDFGRSALEVHNHIRGLNPWPGAFTYINGFRLTVRQSKVVEREETSAYGELLDSKELIVSCGSGAVHLTSVQLDGKKPVSGSDFINGRRLKIGHKFAPST